MFTECGPSFTRQACPPAGTGVTDVRTSSGWTQSSGWDGLALEREIASRPEARSAVTIVQVELPGQRVQREMLRGEPVIRGSLTSASIPV